MELRRTPAPPPIACRADNTLIEDLCIALRHVVTQSDERACVAIDEVIALYEELSRRGIDSDAALNLLSTQTGWQTHVLLIV